MLASIFRRHVLVAALAVANLLTVASPPAQAADAPAFGALSLKTLDGGQVSLKQLRGKVVLLNFWATWCKPCVAEMPVLVSLAKTYHDRGFVVVAASVDEPGSEDEIAKFAGKLPDGMQVWVGATLQDMSRLQVGSALPVSVLLDREGRAVGARQGAVDEGLLDSAIEEALGKAPKKPKPLTGVEQAAAPPPSGPTVAAPARVVAVPTPAAPAVDECCDAEEPAHSGSTAPLQPFGDGIADAQAGSTPGHDHDHDHEHDHEHGGDTGKENASRVPS